jgi:exosortase/archaeosortase family protein
MKVDSLVPSAAAREPLPFERDRWRLSGWLSRGELFAGLLILPCANGLAGRAVEASRELGWHALAAGFDVSAIVWLAVLASLRLVLRTGKGKVTAIDLFVGAVVVALTAVPVPKLSWVALTLSAIYISRASPAGSAMHRGSLICLALTAPMAWGPALMHAYFEPFQRIDALFVSGITGTDRLGSLVQLADGSGYLLIAQACSSFHNISLAMLGWVTASQFVGTTLSIPQQLGWCLLAGASVLTVNVVRISLIALHPHYYHIIHGPVGENVANWLSFGLIAGVCYFGVRRDLPARS